MTASEVKTKITAAVLEILQRRRPDVLAVADGQRLIADLGLESLDLAELVAVLEVELGVDPFQSQVSIAETRTVGDLYAAYTNMSQAT